MCLIAFAWRAHPHYRLVLAGNRDEVHDRPTSPLGPWKEDDGRLLAGRDLECGGTWLGVTADGERAAVVTNVRDPGADQERHSRGWLVLDYLRGDPALDCRAHAAALVARAANYRPFNLLLFDKDDASYVGNHPSPSCVALPANRVIALSNGSLDSDWPKTRRLRAALVAWLGKKGASLRELFTPLADETRAPDAELPDTGMGLERERLLSPAFIQGERYGTRASTLLAIAHDGSGEIIECRFGPNGVPEGETGFRFGAG